MVRSSDLVLPPFLFDVLVAGVVVVEDAPRINSIHLRRVSSARMAVHGLLSLNRVRTASDELNRAHSIKRQNNRISAHFPFVVLHASMNGVGMHSVNRVSFIAASKH